MAVKRTLAVMSMFCVIVFPMVAQNDSITHVAMDDIVVVSESMPRRTADLRLSTVGETHWGMEAVQLMPSLTGVADPMAQLQTLPGIQSTNELDGGIYVQGFDNAHNFVTLDGVPVYGAQHLLGFFSVFNALHFDEMAFGYTTPATRAGRLGAHIGMVTADSLGSKPVAGQATLSPLETLGTLSCRTGKHSQLTLSGRGTDINLLYDNIINRPNRYKQRFDYAFGDVNATWLFQPDERNRLKAFAYLGRDDFGWTKESYATDTWLSWGNALAGASWHHRGATGSLTSELFTTRYSCHSTIGTPNISADIQSLMATHGMRATYDGWTRAGHLEYGAEYLLHRNIAPDLLFREADGTVPAAPRPLTGHEASLFGQFEGVLTPDAMLRVGGRATYYHSDRSYLSLDPQVLFQYDGRHGNRWHCSLGSFSQYLTQTAILSASLPLDGWMIADKTHRPQHAWKAEAGWEREFSGQGYFLSANVFYGLLQGQWEFTGNIMSAFFDTFELDHYLQPCNGRAWGTSLMAQKRQGRLTGWLAATLLRSLREPTDNGATLTHPASHERPIEVNAVATYHLNDRLTFTANALWAMGAPYTQIENAYILQENLLLEMGTMNGARYPATHRIDLGTTYAIPTRGQMRHELTFCIYNATWAQNPLMYQYDYLSDQQTLEFSSVSLFTTCIPSIAYSFRF